MAGYADYAQYTTLYLLGREPAIAELDFPFWSQRASNRVDMYTFDRLKDADTLAAHENAVVLAVCELAEYLNKIDEFKGLQSVSITGHSMSFDGKQQQADADEIIKRHLAFTGLLYAGVG